jgi:hypothetical protein
LQGHKQQQPPAFRFALVELRFEAILVEHETVAQHMVYMAMGVEQRNGLKAVFVYKLYYGILLGGGVHAGIDDHAFLAIVE